MEVEKRLFFPLVEQIEQTVGLQKSFDEMYALHNIKCKANLLAPPNKRPEPRKLYALSTTIDRETAKLLLDWADNDRFMFRNAREELPLESFLSNPDVEVFFMYCSIFGYRFIYDGMTITCHERSLEQIIKDANNYHQKG